MPKTPHQTPDKESTDKKKNIKNIYVQKINSLMKLSNSAIPTEEVQLSTPSFQKKIRKVFSDGKLEPSENDKSTLKLQKNRQSAKRARQRKKLYVQLLERQIQILKGQAINYKQKEKRSEDYLRTLKNKKNKVSEENEFSDVGKYFENGQIFEEGSIVCDEKNSFDKMQLHVREMPQFILPPFIFNLQQFTIEDHSQSRPTNFFNQKLLDLPNNKVVKQILKEKGQFEKIASDLDKINLEVKRLRNQKYLGDKNSDEEVVVGNKVQQLLKELSTGQGKMQKQCSQEKQGTDIFINTQEVEKVVIEFTQTLSKQNL